MRHRSSALVLAVVCGLAFLAGPAGTASAGVPSDQLKTQIERVIKTLEDPELRKDAKAQTRRAAVRKIAEDIFDFGETAKRSLGRHWAARTPAEREEFTQLFADLLERSYLSKIELYGGEKIQFAGDSVEGDIATVKTRIMTKSGSEVPIDYKMLRKGDRWLVYDVVIEGVSLISNYRTQFNKIIQTSSYPELVKKLKTKQGEFIQDEKSRKVSG
jgi:phospholipid transport system substrate-binding protein